MCCADSRCASVPSVQPHEVRREPAGDDQLSHGTLLLLPPRETGCVFFCPSSLPPLQLAGWGVGGTELGRTDAPQQLFNCHEAFTASGKGCSGLREGKWLRFQMTVGGTWENDRTFAEMPGRL